MDTFFEQIIVRKPTKAENIVKILTVIFGCMAVAMLIFMAFIYALGALSFLLVPLALGLGVLLYFWIRNTYIEYEYSITNGSFDIDRIKGRRRRERLISVECSDFEEFGAYDKSAEARLKGREFGAVAFAANRSADELYFAVSSHRKFGSVLLVIQPDTRVKSALKKFVPRQVQKDVLGGFGPSGD